MRFRSRRKFLAGTPPPSAPSGTGTEALLLAPSPWPCRWQDSEGDQGNCPLHLKTLSSTQCYFAKLQEWLEMSCMSKEHDEVESWEEEQQLVPPRKRSRVTQKRVSTQEEQRWLLERV